MKRWNYALTLGLAFAVGVLGTLLLVRGGEGVAWAQDSGQANYLIGLIGPAVRSDIPFVLIDTRAQVIMMYQWNTAREQFKFIQARNYQYDRQLMEFRSKGGLSVREARKLAQEQNR